MFLHTYNFICCAYNYICIYIRVYVQLYQYLHNLFTLFILGYTYNYMNSCTCVVHTIITLWLCTIILEFLLGLDLNS